MYLQKSENIPLASIIESEYLHLAGRGTSGSSIYIIPSIKEMIIETSSSAYQMMRENDAKAALMRNEHEIYSMTKKQFLKEVFNGHIKVQSGEPLDDYDIHQQVTRFLQSRYMSYTDYEEKIWNCHIGCEVW